MKKTVCLMMALVLGGMLSAADLLPGLQTKNIRAGKNQAKVLKENGKTVLEVTGTPYANDPKRSRYMVFKVVLPQPVDLQDKTLKLTISCKGDPVAPGLYIRAYNAGEKQAVWSFFSWKTPVAPEARVINLTGERSRILDWEPKMTSGKPADKVNMLEFHFGCKQDNNPQAVRITGLEVIPKLAPEQDRMPHKFYTAFQLPLPELTEVATLTQGTGIVKGRKAEAILLHPDTAEGKKAARVVADAIAGATGVKITARPGTAADRTPGQTVIMMGNLVSNPALQVLYSRYQTAVDEFLPGPGGYTVESIQEPFVRNQDVIVLGASDDAGLMAGARVFADLVRRHGKAGELVIPRTFVTHYTANIGVPRFGDKYVANGIQTAHNRLKNGTHTSLGGQLSQIGLNYLKYRNPLDAKLYAEVARIYVASAKGDPRKFGGPWGFDSDFPSFEAIGGWDLMEHDPVLTDEDRLAVSNMILRWTHEAIFAEARGGLRSRGPVGNHLTHCSIGAMMSALYFGKYYSDELPHPAIWLDTVKKNFARQYVHGKAFDDCDSYQWLTWRHVLLYAMALPDYTVFKNGVADKVLKVAGTTMDNLGAQSPYGDTNGWRSSGSDLIVLKMFYAATGSPMANAMLHLKTPYDTRRKTPSQFFRTIVPGKIPTDLDGVTVIPLDPGYYKFIRADQNDLPLEKCFDKFSFREKLDPQGLYLLVDGINNGGHGHNDANSVLRYSQFGRTWLAENEYVKNQQKYHNSLLVYCDGEAFALPSYMELVDRQENADFALLTVRANRLGKSDWTRYYIWFKQEKAWMLIDELAAREAGTFRLIQRWNGVGERTAHPDGYELEQKGVRVRLQTSADIPLSSYDNADLGRQWISYPHADAVIRVMDQTLEKNLTAGEKVRMAALWHGVPSGAVPTWAVDRTAQGFRVHTGKTLYTVNMMDQSRLAVAKSALDQPVPPRRNLAAAAAKAAAADVQPLWQQQFAAEKFIRLTARENRSAIPVRVNGTKPAPVHLFFPSVRNRLSSLQDGSWSEGSDSVMFERNRTVTLKYMFDTPQNVHAVEFQTWWGTSPRFSDLPFGVRNMEVQLSNDDFRKDIRKVAFHDSSRDTHTGFSNAIPYHLSFPEQQAKQVRVIVTPPENGAVYLAEVSVMGAPSANARILRRMECFNRVIRVQEKDGSYLAAGTAGGRLFLLSEDGKEQASYSFPGAVNDLAALDVDKDGKKELILVCQDGYCRVIRKDGKLVWRYKFPYYRLFPAATIVRTADLEGDGEPEIIVGCDNWRTYVLNCQGKELWNYEVIRQTRAVQIIDLNGDGLQELICGTAYMTATVLNHKGYHIWRGPFGNGCRATAAPLNGNQRNRTVVLGFDNGMVNFYNAKGKITCSFNAGDEIFMMTEAPESNGKQDVYVCCYNGFVYRLSVDARVVWARALPDSVVRIALLPDGGLAAGTIGGDVCLLTPDGKIRNQHKFSGLIKDLTVEGQRLLVATDNGVVAALPL